MKKILLCPSCKAVVPSTEALRPSGFPFCSERCKQLDLGKWFAEDYHVPSPLDPADEESIQAVLNAQAAEA